MHLLSKILPRLYLRKLTLCPYNISSKTIMHSDHQTFVTAIHSMKKLKLTFFSKQDGGELIRMCAPTDFGPSRRAKDKSDRYHFWDYESDAGKHILSLLPGQIIQIQSTEESFDPSDFIIWDVKQFPWFLQRNWGVFS
jgi:hypothetical protein